jgi:four helix bundle protein
LDLVIAIYKLTASFPKQEMFGLVSQIRRAAISIPSNIAEGYGRRSDGDFARFILISRGSLLELETQLLIAKNLELAKKEDFMIVENLLVTVFKLTRAFLRKLQPNKK